MGSRAALGLGWAALRPGARARLRTLAIPCVLAAVGFAFWNVSLGSPSWRQANFVAQNASWLLRATAERDFIAPLAPATGTPDLDGEALVPFGDATCDR